MNAIGVCFDNGSVSISPKEFASSNVFLAYDSGADCWYVIFSIFFSEKL